MATVDELNTLMKDYVQKFSASIAKRDYDSAITMGLNVLEKLLKIASEEIISNLSDPALVKIGEEILKNHESTLSYVNGVLNGLRYVSPIYALSEKEQLVQIISSSVSELFNFIMGALLIVASIQGKTRVEESFGVV